MGRAAMPLLARIVKGVDRLLANRDAKPRLALTLDLFARLMTAMPLDGTLLRATVRAALSILFWHGFRIDETVIDIAERFNAFRVLRLRDLSFDHGSLAWTHWATAHSDVTLRLKSSKTDQAGRGADVAACDLPSVFAPSLHCIQDMLRLRVGAPLRPGDPLLLHQGIPLTRRTLLHEFKLGLARAGFERIDAYTLYSMKRGLVSSAILAGLPAPLIGHLCRHESDAWRCYDGIPKDVRVFLLKTIARAFSGTLPTAASAAE